MNRRGFTVSKRAKTFDQTKVTIIHPDLMVETYWEDQLNLGKENIEAQYTGLVVDYLTRFAMGGSLYEAFLCSIKGGIRSGKFDEVTEHMTGITGIDDRSIQNAYRTCLYDSYFRAGVAPSIDPYSLNVDHQTCENVRIMVGRCKRVLDELGPVTEIGPRFPGAYTSTVFDGDGDYLTESTVWDLKVSKYEPSPQITLQLAMYYILGKHSTNAKFSSIHNIGVFNPRLNRSYTLDMRLVPKESLTMIETEVIGYGKDECLDW